MLTSYGLCWNPSLGTWDVRTRWRFVLLLVTIPALVVYANGRWGLSEENSGAESAAFQSLHQMQSSINASRAEHQKKDYPDTLPSMNLSPYAQKYYRFEYIPRRSANGEIVASLSTKVTRLSSLISSNSQMEV